MPELTPNNGRPMKDPQKQRINDLEHQLKIEKLKVLAYEKICSWCGKEFIAHKTTTMCCSHKCVSALYIRRESVKK